MHKEEENIKKNFSIKIQKMETKLNLFFFLFLFFLIFLLKKIRLYNIECWKKKRRTKNRYNIDNTEKKLHRFTTYKYKYRVSLQQINLITILTKTRKKKK